MSSQATRLVVFVILCVRLTAVQIQNGACMYRNWEAPGDVKILLIGGIFESEAGICTNRLSRDGVPHLLIFDWLINTFNGENSNNESYIPGLKIGYEIYDTCDDVDLATDLLYSDNQVMNCPGQQTDQAVVPAVVTLTSPETSKTISRLVNPLPVLRPIPSSPLLVNIPNLFQTTAAFSIETQAMVDLLVKKKWNYIALVSEDTEVGLMMTEEFKSMAKNRSICVNYHYRISITSAALEQQTNNITQDLFSKIARTAYELSIVVVYLGGPEGAYSTVRASKTQTRQKGSKLTWIFPASIGNHDQLKVELDEADLMLSLYYPTESFPQVNEHFKSVVNGSKASPITELVQMYNAEYGPLNAPIKNGRNVVDAVLSLTNALKQTVCTVNNLGVTSCASLPNDLDNKMANHVKDAVNVPSAFAGHFLPSSYKDTNASIEYTGDGTRADFFLDFLLYTKSTRAESKLFTYIPDGIPAVSLPISATSACKTECWECREALDLRYSYLPGDYLILGLFSLRTYDPDTNRCQELRRGTNDIITVSAFMQSILKKRNDTNIKFGGIAIDDCYTSYNTSHYLSGLFSKTNFILDPASGLPIDFDRVVAIIGALSSSVTLVIGDVATSLKIPMISYAASAQDLDNRDRYPYFLRTVPSDILQVRGIIELVRQLNVTRIGVIYIDDPYGKSGLKYLQTEARLNNICIDSPQRLSLDMSDEDIEDVVRKLSEKQLGVVVYFSIDSIAQKLLEKVYDNLEYHRPVLIASEAWGTNKDLITGDLGRASKGSLVFNIAALQYKNPSFDIYLKDLDGSQVQNNRWIPNVFEKEYRCDFIDSFEKYYGEICDLDPAIMRLDPDTVNSLFGDQRGIHVTNAVHTVTEAYRTMCFDRHPMECSRVKPDQFAGTIDDARINSERVYTPDGNGNIGMTIYSIQRNRSDSNEFYYQRVGSLSKDGDLSISAPLTFYNGVRKEVTSILEVDDDMATFVDCNMFTDECSSVCLQRTSPTTTTPTPVTVTQSPQKDDSLMRALTIAFGALAGIMAVALILLIVLLFRRQDVSGQSSDGKYSTEATSVDAGNASIYDEPGAISYGKSRSENDFRFTGTTGTGSFLSLQDVPPTQYAKIQPSPTPIHHKRHRSNQELVSHHSYLQDRPPSPQSAPFIHLQTSNSPAVRHAAKRSPKPKHSPHNAKASPKFHSLPRNQELYKKRGDASPKTRQPYKPSSYPTSGLRESSVDSSPVLRRQTALASDDYEDRNSVFVDDLSAIEPSPHHPDGYLYPKTGDRNGDLVDKPKLTYLTANDLMREESLDEEDKQLNEESNAQSTRDSIPVNTRNSNNNQAQLYGYDPSLISPTDSEITAINFPESGQVGFTKSRQSKPLQSNPREASFLDSPVEKPTVHTAAHSDSSGTFTPPSRSNQPDIIPEVGPFESDTGVVII